MVERRSLISHVCITWEGGAIRTPAGSVHDVISSYHPTPPLKGWAHRTCHLVDLGGR